MLGYGEEMYRVSSEAVFNQMHARRLTCGCKGRAAEMSSMQNKCTQEQNSLAWLGINPLRNTPAVSQVNACGQHYCTNYDCSGS
jgi:hypothetical protein